MSILTPYVTYIKIGGALAVVAGASGAGFHFGSLSADAKLADYKTSVEAQHAAQLQAVTDDLTAQIQTSDAKRAALQKVVDAYDQEKDKRDSDTADLAQRLQHAQAAAASAGRCSVPAAGSVASGTQAASPQPGSDQSAERLSGLTQAVFDACSADAKQLNAVVQLAP